MPRLSLNADYVVQRYLSGISINKLAQELSVSSKAVTNCLRRAGIALRAKPSPDLPVVVSLYRSGMSENKIAEHFSVSRGCIRNRLIKAGITPRTQSEAESLKWSQMTAEQRASQVLAANKAARGRVHSEKERIQRAQSIYGRQLRISDMEQRVAQVLRAHGLAVEQQFPVHACNVDIAIHPGPIAVEIHGGGWHSTALHRRLMAQKREQLFSRGWALIEVWVDRRYSFADTTDELIALLDQLGRLPSVSGEHWVVLGNRNQPIALRADSDDIPAVCAADPGRQDATLDLSVP